MAKLGIILLTAICLLSCGIKKHQDKIDGNVINWTFDKDTIAKKILLSYKYPKTLEKDFILNGLCFGQATPEDKEFPNDMKLCIWFNSEELENVDTIINSEGRFPFIAENRKLNITVDNKNALKIQYLNDKKNIVKQLIILKDKETIYQIIANDIDTVDFKYFIDNLKIEEIKNVP